MNTRTGRSYRRSRGTTTDLRIAATVMLLFLGSTFPPLLGLALVVAISVPATSLSRRRRTAALRRLALEEKQEHERFRALMDLR